MLSGLRGGSRSFQGRTSSVFRQHRQQSIVAVLLLWKARRRDPDHPRDLLPRLYGIRVICQGQLLVYHHKIFSLPALSHPGFR